MPLCLPRSASLPLLAAAVLLVAGSAGAQNNAQNKRADASGEDSKRAEAGNFKYERREDRRALSAAVRRVQEATNGQVLSAERVPFDGRDVNRIKVVDDRGRVRVFWDDPRSKQSAPRRPALRKKPAVASPARLSTRRDDSDDPKL